MRTVIQRVQRAAVCVDGEEVGAIDRGILVLSGFVATDTDETLGWMARKIVSLRVFEDADGKMNLDLDTVDGQILVVPQFTLYGDCRKGKRPSFEKSAAPDVAQTLFERFVELLREATPADVQTGVFQSHMNVSLVNDGPVTLVLEKESK